MSPPKKPARSGSRSPALPTHSDRRTTPQPRPRAPLPFSPARDSIIVLTLLALLLGGATELWEQAVIALLAAGIIWVAPPRRSLGLVPNLICVLLLVLSLAAFLPATLGFSSPWRQHLVENLHLTLPGTRTPQPWITLQSCCLLLLGLVWAYHVLAQQWTSETRLQATRLLVLGVSLLAALAIAAFSLGFHVPNWNQEENRGWFPNRNQTADVLALCGVLNYALVFDCLRKRRKSLYLWLCTLAILDAALIISYSRAGILLFFGGVLLWHLWPIRREGGKTSSAKWVFLSLTLVFLLLTGFFLFGGDTLERFAGPSSSSSQDNNFRWAIQQDAFHFSLQSPFLGVSLANFEPLFASARHASINADRTIHPESDWLWMACEMGWLAPLLILSGVIWWLRRCLPFEVKSGESLRRALVVAGVLFLLHGLVDVSGHRLGSVFVALLVFSLAVPPVAVETARPLPPFVFRGLAAFLAVIGLWWIASVKGAPVPPTTANLERAENEIDQALAQAQLAKMEKITDAALIIAPINWHLYFQRAYAETFQPGKLARASNDFMIARQLESKWVKPCVDEGTVWLAAGQPDLCMDAWEEALRRATPEEAPDLFRDMASRSHENDMVHADLLELASGHLDDQLIFLNDATPDETKQIITSILARDPDLKNLNLAQRQTLFNSWWTEGDREGLVTELRAHPNWLDAGWYFLAQSDAAQKNFQDAWKVVARYAPAPIIPAVSTSQTAAELETAFYDQSDNLAAGILLELAQKREGHLDEAIGTLRTLERNKACPKYVYYLEAQLWAQKQQWELAWNAWWSYHTP